MKKRIVIFRILTALAILAMMIIIFYFSSQNGESSSQSSGNITQDIIDITVPSYPSMSVEEQTSLFNKLQHIIRKCAHFFNFFMLGLFSMLHLLTYKLKYRYFYIIAVPFCALYAASDEFHQLFVSGRGASIKDVIIDTSGSICGITLVFLIYLLIVHIKNKRKIKLDNKI